MKNRREVLTAIFISFFFSAATAILIFCKIGFISEANAGGVSSVSAVARTLKTGSTLSRGLSGASGAKAAEEAATEAKETESMQKSHIFLPPRCPSNKSAKEDSEIQKNASVPCFNGEFKNSQQNMTPITRSQLPYSFDPLKRSPLESHLLKP